MSGSAGSRDASSRDLPKGGFRPAHVVCPDLVPAGLHPDHEPRAGIPVGGLRPVQQTLDWSEASDIAPVPAVSLRLSLGGDGDRFPPERGADIAELLRVLDEFDREAGGSGLVVEIETRSVEHIEDRPPIGSDHRQRLVNARKKLTELLSQMVAKGYQVRAKTGVDTGPD